MKRQYLILLFFLLSLTALLVIDYDYICGHTADELMALEYCPICDSFRTTGKVVVVVFALLFLGLMCCVGSAGGYYFFVPSSYSHTSFSLRAPPAIR